MRFPMQSWEKSDSGLINTKVRTFLDCSTEIEPIFGIGPNDLALAQKLIASGADSHSKFLRQIMVCMDITAPRYWWSEMDTYKVGTTANSESTMHRLAKTPITPECFSFDSVTEHYQCLECNRDDDSLVEVLCDIYENYRLTYLETGDQRYWRALVQLLPSSWNQMRHWTANFQVLRKIYIDRRFHKLQEWRDFCAEIEKLPYGKELITFGVNKNDTTT